jgi:SAM-dependent methyltransferase
MSALENLPNPKRDRSSLTGRAAWYPYYAGFSASFAQAVLEQLAGPTNSRVLDPWNGSGTTTAVTAGNGFDGFGFDLNPVMVVVARARLLNKRERTSLVPLAKLIINTRMVYHDPLASDPLRLWFKPDTVSHLRSIEQSIKVALLEVTHPKAMYQYIAENEISDTVAFFYVALFRTVRTLLATCQSSNPTWLKLPKTEEEKLSFRVESLAEAFLAQISTMVAALDRDDLNKDGKVTVKIGQSQHLQLPDSSIDFILSSPPYCTRIDYATTTRAELAVLGLNAGESFNTLRTTLLGSTSVPAIAAQPKPEWGKTCCEFLERVRRHPSKASASYYYKGHCHYFDGIYDSMREAARCLRTGASMCLVVQGLLLQRRPQRPPKDLLRNG